MKNVMNLFKIFSKSADKPDSSDIYPKYRVVETYDGYRVEMQEYSEEEAKGSMYRYSDWQAATWETYTFKFLAEDYAKNRILNDQKQREREKYEKTVVWGPAP